MRKPKLVTLTAILALSACGQENKECYTDFDCDKETVCQSNSCVPLQVNDEGKVVNRVKIHQAVTNSDGKVSFIDYQTKENVDFFVSAEQPIKDARVTFIDGDNFEGFITKHNDHLPSFEIFPHNSSHSITLSPGTTGFTKINQQRYENPTTEFITPMHELITWGKENALEYQGCQTRDEFIKNYKDTLSVISHVASAGGAGASVDKLFSVIGKTTDYTLKHSDLLELEETEIVHIYRSNKIVPDFNSLFEGGFYQEEDCFNNKDDNCDGFLDLADPDCEGADCEFEKYICTPNNEKASIDNCGKIYDKTSCDPGNCIDAECIICEYDKNICLDHEMLAKIDTCGNVYSENFAYCGNGTVCTDGDCIDDGCDYSHTICTDFSTIASVDTCGNIYDKNNCSNGCEDGACTGGGCTYTSTICIDSNTKASKDSCGNTYNQVDCSDKCVDGSCVTGPDCDPLVGTCLDKYTTGWKDQCGNTGQTGTCTGGKVCEGNGNCVDAPTDSCDPLPTGWFMCGCPEKHGVNCHEAGWSCD